MHKIELNGLDIFKSTYILFTFYAFNETICKENHRNHFIFEKLYAQFPLLPQRFHSSLKSCIFIKERRKENGLKYTFNL